MKKRILLLVLSLFLLLSALPACPGTLAAARDTSGLYGRQALSGLTHGSNLVSAYDAIYAGVEKSLVSIDLASCGLTAGELETVFNAYRNDSPEHFWLGTGYSYSGSGGKIVSLKPVYSLSGSALTSAKTKFNAAADRLLADVRSSGALSAALALHDALIAGTEYTEGSHAHDAFGALVDGKAVCEGYARAYQYLLQQKGIACLYVTGKSRGEAHGWNIMQIDGNWSHTDVTWDDQDSALFHYYFACTDSQILADHTMDSMPYALPVCKNSASQRVFKTSAGNLFSSLTVDAVSALLSADKTASGAQCAFEYTGSTNIGSWLNSNISAIAGKLGFHGSFSYGTRSLGKEIQLYIIAGELVYDQEVASEQYLFRAADCEHAAVYYKSARSGEKSPSETFTYGKPLGHTYAEEWTVDEAATCTKAGSKSHHCVRCSAKSDITAIPAGHNWGAWTVTREADCTHEGEKSRTCQACKKKETETVKALGHEYALEWTIDEKGSCTEAGSQSHHCIRCGAKTDITVLPEGGHEWGGWTAVREPDCTNPGEEKHACTLCGKEETREIPALRHNFDDPVIVRAATISEPGLMQGKCTRCGEATEETIPCSATDEKTGIRFEAEEGSFPAGTQIAAEPVPADHPDYAGIQEALQGRLREGFTAYSLQALQNGTAVQPGGTVRITFPLPEGLSGDGPVLYRVEETGTVRRIACTAEAETGTVTAETDALGCFVLGVSEDAQETEKKKTDAEATPDAEHGTASPDSGTAKKNGFPVLAAVGIALGALVLLAVILILVKKGKKNP